MELSPLRPDAARSIQPAADSVESQESREAAEGFAAILLGTLVKEMWKTISLDGEEGGSEDGGGGPGGSIYQGMAQTALADALAKQGMHGLADRIEQALQPKQREEAP